MEINNFSGRIFSNPKIPINHWVIKELSTADESLFTDPKKSKQGDPAVGICGSEAVKEFGFKKRERKHETRETR